MGSSFSTTAPAAAAEHSPTARVIEINCKLVEYSASLSAANFLGLNHPSRFLCNSDTLFQGRFLGRELLLGLGRLYSLLPASMLQQ
ncbi:hypothetical protein HPP92_019659 [Vanilla planifolia]|uniref:Uncharacterized protein n=1 Tax=Vanilla planifolia TaxID=51239 RepID=A0A835Q3L3_VANPL|nr:hypothetical protein HPP92_019659 [Vanilla planifolia]